VRAWMFKHRLKKSRKGGKRTRQGGGEERGFSWRGGVGYFRSSRNPTEDQSEQEGGKEKKMITRVRQKQAWAKVGIQRDYY